MTMPPTHNQEAEMCRSDEQALIDQRLFWGSSDNCQALLDLLEQPEKENAGLSDLLSRKAPWEPLLSE